MYNILTIGQHFKRLVNLQVREGGWPSVVGVIVVEEANVVQRKHSARKIQNQEKQYL